MPEKTCTSSPNSSRRCSRAARDTTRLFCPPELPGVSLVLARASTAAQPRHAHDALVFGLVTAGARRIHSATQSARIIPGEAFVLTPGLAHACAPDDGPCSYIAVSVEPSALPTGFPQALPLRLCDARLAEVLTALAEAVERSGGRLERQSLLAEALEALGAHGLADGALREEALALEVARAVEMLEQNLEPGLDLTALAEACGAQPYALHRAFTRATGLPPHAFQTRARLRRAKALLRQGAELIQAALAAGFCDQSHMHRHFTRVVGLTPAQYARAHGRKD